MEVEEEEPRISRHKHDPEPVPGNILPGQQDDSRPEQKKREREHASILSAGRGELALQDFLCGERRREHHFKGALLVLAQELSTGCSAEGDLQQGRQENSHSNQNFRLKCARKNKKSYDC